MKKKIEVLLALVLFGLLTAAITYFVRQSGSYPAGDDAMYYVYKGDVLYQEISRGNFYPLLDSMWYNGVENLRWQAPLPVYVLALCEALAMGNPFTGYLIFVGLAFLGGALVWLWIGCRHDRRGLGVFLGALWFFMPNNLYALFAEGNLSRALSMVLLPWLMELIYTYLTRKKWQSLVLITLSYLLLCQTDYALCILLAVAAFCVLYTVLYRGGKKCLQVLAAMALSGLLAGIWLYPSVKSGLADTDSLTAMAGYFQSALVSLNPFYRVLHGAGGTFYFGLAAFLLALAGMFFGKKKSAPFFGCAVLTLICTSSAMYPVLNKLPGRQYLWMLRYISIALCMVLFGLMLWTSLKRNLLMFFSVLLVLDTVPSLPLLFGSYSGKTVEERLDAMEEETLLGHAKELTKQRLALLDLGTLGATGAFLTSGYGNGVPAAFGAGWQSANTASNIVLLNEALETGRYLYVFDRCLELGNDTVLVRNACLRNGFRDEPLLDEAAERVGYGLVEVQGEYRLYHMEIPGSFGVVTDYHALAIGENVGTSTLDFPAMGEGWSANLNDYTFDELKQYEMLLLSGFTYDDKSAAEQLVLDLSEAGVRVVIAASGMPEDEYTGVVEFLDVVSQPIQFRNGYPLLDTIDGVLDCSLFPSGYSEWKTEFLNGLDECWGKLEESEGVELEFYGTVKNDNIVVVGLNLFYYLSLTEDEAIEQLLSHAINISGQDLPERELVPVELVREADSITVRTERNNVNTTLAWHDIFEADGRAWEKNNLTYVSDGETVIRLRYSYFWEGLLISLLGLAGSVTFYVLVAAYWRRRYIQEAEVLEVVRPMEGVLPEYRVSVPDEVKYSVADVQWCRKDGGVMDVTKPFDEGEYCIRIWLKAREEEYFRAGVRATVNGLKANLAKCLEDNTMLLVEMNYSAVIPFRYLQQPQSVTAPEERCARIDWSVSKRARVGYLQVMEEDGWIICDTLPTEEEKPLTYSIVPEGLGSYTYRLVYILENGRDECSEEFTVTWEPNRQ